MRSAAEIMIISTLLLRVLIFTVWTHKHNINVITGVYIDNRQRERNPERMKTGQNKTENKTESEGETDVPDLTARRLNVPSHRE